MGRSDETGNCTKCAHSSEIARAVEFGDEKKIESLRRTCIRCIRGCDKCRWGREKDGIEAKLARLQGNDEDGVSGDLKARLENIEKSMCMKCNRCPLTDDNPSRAGKEVISFDAAEDPDTIMPHSEGWGNGRNDSDFRDFDSRENEHDDKGRVTSLPLEVEDALRHEICNLSGKLDHVDRALVFFLMAGGTLTDFGKMKWVPKEFFSTMSKQCVYGRYKKIVRAVPILASVAHGMIGKGKGGGAKPKKSMRMHYQPELF